MTDNFHFRFRVRYSECDAQGIVFNARYGDYADLAMTEFFRALGNKENAFIEHGLDCKVAQITITWQGSASFDDIIDAAVKVSSTGNTSFIVEETMSRTSDGMAICHAEIVYVLISADSGEKIPIPDAFRALMEAGADGVLIDQSGHKQKR